MSMILSLIAVGVLVFIPVIFRVIGLDVVLGFWIPILAIITFAGGFLYRIFEWAKVPVPFKIPTTCGQQESLDWIPNNKLEAPKNNLEVVARMFMEVFFFRSLFRNTKTDPHDGVRLTYSSDKLLWLMGLAFHYSFLVIFIRHFRLFAQEPPMIVGLIESLDGWLQLTLPTFYMTDAVILGAVGVLFLRRLVFPQVRYISLAADFFPLFLILGIAVTGIVMRYGIPNPLGWNFRADVVTVKSIVVGIFTLKPTIPESVNLIFYIHLMLVSSLFAYFPFSKLMHMGGVFMSPTRNMANNSRKVRHINPWNPEIKIHTYMEYEDDFRAAMKSVGLPLEKDIEEEEEK